MNENALAPAADPAPVDTSTAGMLMDPRSFDHMERWAVMLSKARAVPAHLKNSPADCFIVVLQATQWRMNPVAVAGETSIVHGNLAYGSKLVDAVLNASGTIKNRLQVEWFGDWGRLVGKWEERESRHKDDNGDPKKYVAKTWSNADEEGLGVRISGVLRGETEPRVYTLFLRQVHVRNSPLWVTDPAQQLSYLGKKKWSRVYAPEVLMGVYSPDEFEDAPTPKDMGLVDEVSTGAAAGTPPPPPPSTPPADRLTPSELQAWKDAAGKGKATVQKHWRATPRLAKLATEAQRQEVWAIAEKADRERTVENEAGGQGAAAAPPPPAAAPAPATQEGAGNA